MQILLPVILFFLFAARLCQIACIDFFELLDFLGRVGTEQKIIVLYRIKSIKNFIIKML